MKQKNTREINDNVERVEVIEFHGTEKEYIYVIAKCGSARFCFEERKKKHIK